MHGLALGWLIAGGAVLVAAPVYGYVAARAHWPPFHHRAAGGRHRE